MGGKTAQSEKIAGKQRNPKKGRGKRVLQGNGGKARASTVFSKLEALEVGNVMEKISDFGSMPASRLWPLLEQRSAACAVAPLCFACAKPPTASNAGWLLLAYTLPASGSIVASSQAADDACMSTMLIFEAINTWRSWTPTSPLKRPFVQQCVFNFIIYIIL